ncbi:MAG TPA: hypothetical protein VHS99_18535 [Chloroflexota bacterium]|nr:hypothetical protein [Chloroflexota bacterium]HEX2036183.1 hypothetical protein [Chloroflexota bacterium]
MTSVPRATIADLYATRAKAELVNGRLRIMDASGHLPGQAALAIAISLRV